MCYNPTSDARTQFATNNALYKCRFVLRRVIECSSICTAYAPDALLIALNTATARMGILTEEALDCHLQLISKIWRVIKIFKKLLLLLN